MGYYNLLLNFDFSFLQDERTTHDPFPDILNIVDDGLEMRGGVIGASDEDVVIEARRSGNVEGSDGDKSRNKKRSETWMYKYRGTLTCRK